jgi:hypothetical protein
MSERSSGQWFWGGFYAALGAVFALFLLSLVPGLVIGAVLLVGQFDVNGVIVASSIVLGVGVLYLLWVLASHGIEWLKQRN